MLSFGYAGFQKLFLTVTMDNFKDMIADQAFYDFYFLLENQGYMKFVGACQLASAVLLIFARTYLLGAIMLMPIVLNLVATHIFMSKNWSYAAFDFIYLAAVAFLIVFNYKKLFPIIHFQSKTLI
jgi:hypothetical protein